MDLFSRIIRFTSSEFPRHERDDELVNHETMHGYALARYIGQELQNHGMHVISYIPEDWGWYCTIRHENSTIAYGVIAENNEDEFTIQFIPAKPYVRKIFRKIDVSQRLLDLHENVFNILEGAPGKRFISWE